MIQDGVRRFGLDGFRPGDVIITNHQRVAGQHLNNIMIYTPCFAGGELAGFAVTRAHWIDVGGVSTGFGAGNNAIDPWIEGLQLDQIKLYEAGELDEKVWRIIRDNIRFPESSMGDLKSQIAACRLAERRLEELLERYHRDVVQQAIERIFDQTEARCRAAIAQLPDGVYEAESLFGGHSLDNDEPVRIHAKVTIRGSDMEIDLTGCSLQRRQPVNARTLAAPLIAYKAITMPNDPVNEGAFRALTVKIQEGNYMMARYPAPMASWGRTLPTVVDTILSALAPILPDKIPAAHLGVLGRNGRVLRRRSRDRDNASSRRASKAVVGARVRGKMASQARFRCARVMFTMRPSRRWSFAGRSWSNGASCGAIPEGPASTAAG